jgi:hypothetical protein
MRVSLIERLFKEAAIEFSERAKGWMPDWVTQHRAFKEHTKDKIFKIFKQFGLPDFRDVIENPTIIENFKELITSELSKLVSALMNEDRPQADKLGELAYQMLRQVMLPAVWAQSKIKLLAQISSEDKSLRLDAGTSVIKAYNFIKAYASRYNIQMKEIEASNEFKEFSKRGGGTIVVFSTNPEDILAMSSRSDWETCQTLDPKSPGMCAAVIGSSLSKFIGVCYITTGRQFQDRGEEMTYRSLIRFAIDQNTGRPAIVMDVMYPSYSATMAQLMKESLHSHSSLPVFDISTLRHEDPENIGRFTTPEDKQDTLYPEEKPYIDSNIFFKDKDREKKRRQAQNVPVENIESYLSDYLLNMTEQLTNIVFSIVRPFANPQSYGGLRMYCEDWSIRLLQRLLDPVKMRLEEHYRRNPPLSGKLVDSIVRRHLRRVYERGIRNASGEQFRRYSNKTKDIAEQIIEKFPQLL